MYLSLLRVNASSLLSHRTGCAAVTSGKCSPKGQALQSRQGNPLALSCACVVVPSGLAAVGQHVRVLGAPFASSTVRSLVTPRARGKVPAAGEGGLGCTTAAARRGQSRRRAQVAGVPVRAASAGGRGPGTGRCLGSRLPGRRCLLTEGTNDPGKGTAADFPFSGLVFCT
jgi:hypothetical protein